MKKTFFPIFATALCGQFLFSSDFQTDFHPFHFSARPSEKTVADCSHMNLPITEERRISVGNDGHLYAAGERIRIFGTNISGFPKTSDAEYWAKTLASQGINCVRFHHTDSNWTNCFFTRTSSGKLVFSEEGFRRFDKFFYELKKAGIYSNINLLTGRDFSDGTTFADFPAEFNQISDWKDRHCYGFWNETAREDQRQFAGLILNHKNPYTGLTYAEDPAVAFVEVNNENSMMKAYFDGVLNRYPKTLTKEVHEKWTDFLVQKGWTREKLDAAFNKTQDFSGSILSGNAMLEQHDTAKASLTKSGESIKIKVQENGTESWHIQYDFLDFGVESNQIYTINFRAMSSEPSTISASIMMNHDPWQTLGFSKRITLTNKWQNFSFTVADLQGDRNARLTFGDMGKSRGITFQIADVEIKKGGQIKNIHTDDKTLLLPNSEDFRACPQELRELAVEFLRSVDADYWSSMNAFLKDTLKIRALTFGTAITCAPFTVMNDFDVIDGHAYWNHPVFPVSDWNNNDFYVQNRSLVAAEDGGTLFSLAGTRVFGKPFSVTEYDHPWPNQFSSEMMPMLAVFASLQDWDCVYSFCYEISEKNPASAKITGYFNQDSNPAKIAGMPVAARIFREFKIAPLDSSRYARLTPESERKAIASDGSTWNVVPVTQVGVNPRDSLSAKIGVIIPAADGKSAQAIQNTGKSAQRLHWDSGRGFFVYTDEDVFVSVTMPQVQGDFLQFAGIKNAAPLSFSPSDDFAAFAAVRIDAETWLVFSSSWSGNTNENLREYGDAEKKRRYAKTRDNIKLTATQGGSRQDAVALGSSGRISLPGVDAGQWNLYMLDEKGKVIGKKDDFLLDSEDGTLWYVLSSKDLQAQ